MLISFFHLLLWITAAYRTKVFIGITKSGGVQHHKKNKLYSICNNASDIFELNVFSALFLITSLFHSKTNLKTYYEQVKKFFNPPNTQSLSEDCVSLPWTKNLKRLCMCCLFTWFNMQILKYWIYVMDDRRIHNPLKYLKWSVLQK